MPPFSSCGPLNPVFSSHHPLLASPCPLSLTNRGEYINLGIMFLVSASTLLLLLVTVVAQMPWPKERPGGFHIEDFPMLNIIERTAIDPYLYLSKPELGFPKLFRCLPV